MSLRSSWWSITINNPTDDDRLRLKDFPSFVKMVKCQDEVGESGTLHIQGAVNTAQTRLSALKEWLPRAHIEVARDKQALLKYVEKTETAVPNTQVVVQADYLSMDSALLAIASHHSELREHPDAGHLKPGEFQKWEFWRAVRIILRDKPKLVGLLTNPQLERAWVNTRDVWIELLDRQTDRQDEIIIPTQGIEDGESASGGSSSS